MRLAKLDIGLNNMYKEGPNPHYMGHDQQCIMCSESFAKSYLVFFDSSAVEIGRNLSVGAVLKCALWWVCFKDSDNFSGSLQIFFFDLLDVHAFASVLVSWMSMTSAHVMPAVQPPAVPHNSWIINLLL